MYYVLHHCNHRHYHDYYYYYYCYDPMTLNLSLRADLICAPQHAVTSLLHEQEHQFRSLWNFKLELTIS